jgi:hypothetical protein
MIFYKRLQLFDHQACGTESRSFSTSFRGSGKGVPIFKTETWSSSPSQRSASSRSDPCRSSSCAIRMDLSSAGACGLTPAAAAPLHRIRHHRPSLPGPTRPRSRPWPQEEPVFIVLVGNRCGGCFRS